MIFRNLSVRLVFLANAICYAYKWSRRYNKELYNKSKDVQVIHLNHRALVWSRTKYKMYFKVFTWYVPSTTIKAITVQLINHDQSSPHCDPCTVTRFKQRLLVYYYRIQKKSGNTCFKNFLSKKLDAYSYGLYTKM